MSGWHWRGIWAYALIVLVAAAGFGVQRANTLTNCHYTQRSWETNNEQSRVLTEPSVLSVAATKALARGDVAAGVLAAQIDAANARKTEQRSRLVDGLGSKPNC